MATLPPDTTGTPASSPTVLNASSSNENPTIIEADTSLGLERNGSNAQIISANNNRPAYKRPPNRARWLRFVVILIAIIGVVGLFTLRPSGQKNQPAFSSIGQQFATQN